MAQKVETALNQQKRGTASQESVLLSANMTLVVPFSEDRVSLILCPDTANRLYWTKLNNGVANVGINMAANSMPVMLTLAEHGAIVFGPFWASSTAYPTTATFIQGFNNAP